MRTKIMLTLVKELKAQTDINPLVDVILQMTVPKMKLQWKR